jgi:hypothetical protein
MGFPTRQAAVVGVYNTTQVKLPDRRSFSLQLDAAGGIATVALLPVGT